MKCGCFGPQAASAAVSATGSHARARRVDDEQTVDAGRELALGERDVGARDRDVADPRGEFRIFRDCNLLHEGEDARFLQLRRCVTVIGDVAVEHGSGGDEGHGVIGGVARRGCPLLALAAGLLQPAF